MQLEVFVAESLRQIIAGVHKAQGATTELGAVINPHGHKRSRTSPEEMGKGAKTPGEPKPPEVGQVEFDVAVTAATETETSGGINVLAGIVKLGTEGQSNASSTQASRIKFSVPVRLPWAPESDL